MKVSDLGTRLTQAMSWRGMNGDDLARASGVHKSLICRYKKNVREPREDRVEAMAEALGVNPQWLRGYDVPPDKATGSQLTVSPREKKLIEDFRYCDADNQLLIERYVSEKREDYAKRLIAYREALNNANSNMDKE